MQPEVRIIPAKTLIGKRVKTTVATDNPVSYWRPFKMKLKEIENAITDKFYSIQTFDDVKDMSKFTHETEFEKWAAVEVSEVGNVPEELEIFHLPKGKNAIFIHKGTAAEFDKTIHAIYSEWFPQSEYELDDRPHVTIMPENHRPDDPEAEELVYVPVK